MLFAVSCRSVVPSPANKLQVPQTPYQSEVWVAERIYYLPNGTTIEDRGGQPDLQVDAAWWQFSSADDPQIQAAIQRLQQH